MDDLSINNYVSNLFLQYSHLDDKEKYVISLIFQLLYQNEVQFQLLLLDLLRQRDSLVYKSKLRHNLHANQDL